MVTASYKEGVLKADATLNDGQQLAIAIFSYAGMLNFGYLVDAQGVPDVDVFAGCVEEGLRELVEAARQQAGESAPATRRRGARQASKPATAARTARRPSSTQTAKTPASKSPARRKSTTRHRGAA